MGEVKILRTWSCPFALRVAWALKIKGIEHETIYEDLANKSPQLLKYNPIHKKVPVLLHNGMPICESLVILEYIDETWSNTAPFLPQDPLDRATSRFWAKFSDEQVLPSFFGYFLRQGKEQEEAKETTLSNLKLVEELLNQKMFFNGETFGFLDIVFGWLAFYSGPLEAVYGLKLFDEDLFPKISKWKERFCEIPGIAETWPDQETLLVKYREKQQISPNV